MRRTLKRWQTSTNSENYNFYKFALLKIARICKALKRFADLQGPGAHQMEPPSPLISSVNPFPSRFINRTAYFPRKVSYFRESRMSPWKKWSWTKSNSKARPWTVFLFYYTSIFTILQPLGSGCHEIKVNELPDWDWAWSDGTKTANWGSRKGYLCECFFFFLPPYISHLSMHLEKSRRLNVLWTIWNFSMVSAEKVPGSFDFCHHRGVDFAS